MLEEERDVNKEAVSDSFIEHLEKNGYLRLDTKRSKKKILKFRLEKACHELNLDSENENPTTSRYGNNDCDSDQYSIHYESLDIVEPDIP